MRLTLAQEIHGGHTGTARSPAPYAAAGALIATDAMILHFEGDFLWSFLRVHHQGLLLHPPDGTHVREVIHHPASPPEPITTRPPTTSTTTSTSTSSAPA
jgi:hypothetical protein